jgi:hypothetical protein
MRKHYVGDDKQTRRERQQGGHKYRRNAYRWGQGRTAELSQRQLTLVEK